MCCGLPGQTAFERRTLLGGGGGGAGEDVVSCRSLPETETGSSPPRAESELTRTGQGTSLPARKHHLLKTPLPSSLGFTNTNLTTNAE